MQRTLVHERVKVAVPEGFTRFDIARRLQGAKVCAAKAFIEATADPPCSRRSHHRGVGEGYLFPATYELALDAEPSQVVTG